MPFGKDAHSFQEVLDAALRDEELMWDAEVANLDTATLSAALKEKEETVWEAAADELSKLQIARGEVGSAQTTIAELSASSTQPFSLRWLIIALCSVALLASSQGWSEILQIPAWYLALPTVAVAVAALAVLWKAIATRRKALNRATMELRSAETKIEPLEAAARRALLEQGILGDLRKIISSQLKPSYTTALPHLRTRGLAEVYNPQYEVATLAKSRLEELLNSMPGGSIGIAGPRGAGKTTLLSTFSGGRLAVLQGRPVVAVSAAAPVEYGAREFILFIATAVAKAILGKEKAQSAEMAFTSGRSRGVRQDVLRVVQPVTRSLLLLGAILLSLGGYGLISIFVLPEYFQSRATGLALSSPQGSTLPSSGPTVAAGRSSAAGSPAPKRLPTAGARPKPPASTLSTGPAQIDGSPKPGRAISAESITEMLHVLSSLSTQFLTWGIVCLVVFIASRRLRADSAKQAEDQGGASGGTPGDRTLDSLETAAAEMLSEARFQQSFSQGWSGTLKLPAALEGTAQRGVSLAQNQRSLPELVEQFRELIDFATAAGRAAIIGIDELDKIGSTEAAYKFLNEIKAIFGLRYCFYLLSVSEDALAQFELRGLPFRDAFDSAFDGVVLVDYLNLQSSRQLLSRRIVGMPVPFVALCHCFSGGLPRDLIRTARDIHLFAGGQPPMRRLSEITSALISADLEAKKRAAMRAIDRLSAAPDSITVLATIVMLGTSPATASALMLSLQGLIESVHQKEGDGAATINAQRSLVQLVSRLASYLYYAATLLDFFVDGLDAGRVKNAEDRAFDRLSEAKQALAVSPHMSWTQTSLFRAECGMDITAPPRIGAG
jgi:hypothetical protein